MNKTVKKWWIKALRSGKYLQGRYSLCCTRAAGEDRFCALGVLIDVAADGDWVSFFTPVDNYCMWQFQGKTTGLSQALREELGISGSEHNILVDMNDDKGKSFAEIADWIEENL